MDGQRIAGAVQDWKLAAHKCHYRKKKNECCVCVLASVLRHACMRECFAIEFFMVFEAVRHIFEAVRHTKQELPAELPQLSISAFEFNHIVIHLVCLCKPPFHPSIAKTSCTAAATIWFVAPERLNDDADSSRGGKCNNWADGQESPPNLHINIMILVWISYQCIYFTRLFHNACICNAQCTEAMIPWSPLRVTAFYLYIEIFFSFMSCYSNSNWRKYCRPTSINFAPFQATKNWP